MTSHYYRSPILSFYELTDEQQLNVLHGYKDSNENIEDEQFVLTSEESVNPISLSEFMRIDRNGSLFDGYFTTSNTSAYLIKLSKCNTMAVVASKYW